MSWAASEDAAEGMNLVIENYNKGVQVTWQVYTPEEIEADPALGMVQLFYFPAKTENAKYVVVVPGNGGNTTAELNHREPAARSGLCGVRAAVPFVPECFRQRAAVRHCQCREVSD